jgi:hypothetical protein
MWDFVEFACIKVSTFVYFLCVSTSIVMTLFLSLSPSLHLPFSLLQVDFSPVLIAFLEPLLQCVRLAAQPLDASGMCGQTRQ